MRVVFDFMTTALTLVKYKDERLKTEHILRAFQLKNESKVLKIISGFAKKDSLVAYATAKSFAEEGEEKSITLRFVYDQVRSLSNILNLAVDYKDFLHSVTMMKEYGLVD